MTSLQVVEQSRTDVGGGLTDSSVRRTSHVRVARQPERGLLWTTPRPTQSGAFRAEASWFADIESEIRGYLDLAPDWDSYGGGPPTRDVVDAAVAVAQIMAYLGFSRPTVCPQSSGGVMMEWQGSSCIVLTVDIEAIGERPASDWISFALASPGESEREGNFEDLVALLNAGLQPF